MKKPFWYSVPNSLEWNPFNEATGWSAWEKETRKNYPVQYFLRENVYMFFQRRWAQIKSIKYNIQCFFFPKHSEIRKAIPRTWADITSLVVSLNFVMIISFKKEADASCVDWDSTTSHREFKNWLDDAAHWISTQRPELEKQRDNSYPKYPLVHDLEDCSYDKLYGEVNRLESLISETDTRIIKQMIDYREFMWT
jgi:hypothetical protein